MKSFCTLLLLLCVIFFTSCIKSANRPNPINCNNLVTDTLGTNDTARVFAVSAFSPNGDRRNDLYRVITRGLNSIEVTIYDENNTVAFNTTQLNPVSPTDPFSLRSSGGWSPTVAPNNYTQYFYRIQATTNSNHKIGLCGNLYITNCFPSNPNLNLYIYESQLTVANGFVPSIPSGENASNACR